MDSPKFQQILSVVALIIVCWLTWSASMASDRGIGVLAQSGYWIMLLLCGTWLASAYRNLRFPHWSELAVPTLAAATGVAVCFFSSPIGFKVLSDETNLLSVSQSMYQHRTALHPTMGKFYFDNFHATFVSAPTRPLVFPFLLSLCHSLTGYHAENVFFFNGLVLFSVLFLICCLTQRQLGRIDALAAVLLVLSHPILQLMATSGGFDLLSLLVLLGVLITAHHHFVIRSSDSLVLLWLTLIVFAQVRYESIIALPLTLIFLAWRGYITREMVRSRLAYFAAGPLFLFPWLIQRHLNRNSFENPPGVPAFSVEHFLGHLKELVLVNLDFSFYYPYDNILNLAAVGLTGLLFVSILSRDARPVSRTQQDGLALAVILIGSSLIVFLSHHMGIASHPTQARFFIPLSVALAAVPLVVRSLRSEWFSAGTLLVCAITLFVVYQPIVGESRIMHTLILTRETKLAMDYLATFPHRRILTISDRSGHYAALGVGAVDFNTARMTAYELLNELDQRLYDEIVVFQEIDLATLKPIDEHRLDASFNLSIVAEHQISDSRKLRISRSAPAW